MPVGPTPITATHRISISYAISGLPHRFDLFCDAVVDVLATSGYSLVPFSAGLNTDAGAFALNIATDMAPYFFNGDPIPRWDLFQYVGGAYIPLAGGSLSTVGTGGTNPHLDATQMTLFLRDSANKPAKYIVLEGNFPLAARYQSISAMPTALRALPQHLLDMSVGANGQYVRSRGNRQLTRFISAVSTLNRRIRRRRGIA